MSKTEAQRLSAYQDDKDPPILRWVGGDGPYDGYSVSLNASTVTLAFEPDENANGQFTLSFEQVQRIYRAFQFARSFR